MLINLIQNFPAAYDNDAKFLMDKKNCLRFCFHAPWLPNWQKCLDTYLKIYKDISSQKPNQIQSNISGQCLKLIYLLDIKKRCPCKASSASAVWVKSLSFDLWCVLLPMSIVQKKKLLIQESQLLPCCLAVLFSWSKIMWNIVLFCLFLETFLLLWTFNSRQICSEEQRDFYQTLEPDAAWDEQKFSVMCVCVGIEPQTTVTVFSQRFNWSNSSLDWPQEPRWAGPHKHTIISLLLFLKSAVEVPCVMPRCGFVFLWRSIVGEDVTLSKYYYCNFPTVTVSVVWQQLFLSTTVAACVLLIKIYVFKLCILLLTLTYDID